MKNLFAFVIIAASLALAIPAQAQSYGPVTLAAGTLGTSAIAPQTVTNVNRMFKLTDSATRSVAVQASFNAMAASTAPIYLSLDTSLDNVNWVTNAHNWSIPATGVNPTSFITNINFGAIGYGRLAYITNAGITVIVSNVIVKASFKN